MALNFITSKWYLVILCWHVHISWMKCCHFIFMWLWLLLLWVSCKHSKRTAIDKDIWLIIYTLTYTLFISRWNFNIYNSLRNCLCNNNLENLHFNWSVFMISSFPCCVYSFIFNFPGSQFMQIRLLVLLLQNAKNQSVSNIRNMV